MGETYAQHFCLFNAENNEVINDEEIIEMIQTHVPELQGLSYFRANMSDTQYEEVCKLDNDFAYETIAEVKKSEIGMIIYLHQKSILLEEKIL